MALDWTREESILALAVYFEYGSDVSGKIPDSESATAKELSDTLRKLSAYPSEKQPEGYRSKNSVRLKLANFLAAQKAGLGMQNRSQMDAAIVQEFLGRKEELYAEAAAIRAGIESGTVQPASPDLVMREEPVAAEIAVENQHAESFGVNPSTAPRIARRAEAQLVRAYCDHMSARGVTVSRMMYKPPGEVTVLYCDAWVRQRNVLIEAKNSESRDALRQAIGQLYDYRRFHESPGPALAVLLPYRPTGDRSELLRSVTIHAIWPKRNTVGFEDTAGGDFV
jgi:hypothetical protein